MAKTLEEVQKQFPNAKYPPLEGCKYCGGNGAMTGRLHLPCICVYISPELLELAAENLGKTSKKLKQEWGLE